MRLMATPKLGRWEDVLPRNSEQSPYMMVYKTPWISAMRSGIVVVEVRFGAEYNKKPVVDPVAAHLLCSQLIPAVPVGRKWNHTDVHLGRWKHPWNYCGFLCSIVLIRPTFPARRMDPPSSNKRGELTLTLPLRGGGVKWWSGREDTLV